MDKKDDKTNKKIATTEAQNDNETQKFSASGKFSPSADGSVVAREVLLKELEELKKAIEALDNKYKRALADYQNLEKRVKEERNDWILRANKDILLHLLPVLDTLILTKKHSKVEDEGLSLSIKQFQDLLKEEGVEKIDAVGKYFDPKLMQCVETREGEEGKVLVEVRPGYKVHDEILRAALVIVGKA